MSDVFTPSKRSAVMRAVRSKGNKSTELKLISLFREHGIKGWRRGYPLQGKPDFVFPKPRLAVFVDGCFWHGHNCRNVTPQERASYWRNKIIRNKKRDVRVRKQLRRAGWVVVAVWECRLKKSPSQILKMIKRVLYIDDEGR
ncbi:MAG: very short patch repair endonuclease [Candidatus Omnitrophica bacterium]|nr:very short patch repair endonuclease [Candidatus Omnitrophota bacterium]